MDRTVIYGINPVMEALVAGGRVDTVYLALGLKKSTRREIEHLAAQHSVRVLVTQRRELDRMAQGGVHQGVVALAEKKSYVDLADFFQLELEPRTVVLCLDGVQDPRNLGALARSALAFGAGGLVIGKRRSAGITPAAVKASAGALNRLPVARVVNLARALDALKDEGFWVCGAAVDGGVEPWGFDPGKKVVLLLGSEGTGLRPSLVQRLDHQVRIPMQTGMESLNVSVAGALLLYEWLGRPQNH